IVSQEQLGKLQLLAGGLFMGLGIASMHYTGMAAIRLNASFQYNLKLVLLSIGVAIAASWSSLWLAFHLRTASTTAGNLRKLGSAILMGNAIAGTHYVAMAAASFRSSSTETYNQGVVQPFFGINNTLLAVAVGVATLIILTLTLVASVVDQRLSVEATRAEALRQSEARFRSLVQNASDIITVLDAQGTIHYKSPSIERILGYKPEDLVGKNVFEFLHREDVPAVKSAFAKVIQTPGLIVPVIYRFRHAEGCWIYLESVGSNLLEDASVQGVVVNSRNITERKQAENAQHFLAQASAVLADSLDYQTTLTSVARLAVPYMADWCVVDIVDENQSIQRLAVAHSDPEKVALGWELNQRYPEALNGSEGTPKVLRTGQAAIYPQISDAVLMAVAQDAGHLRILRELGFKSAMIVPLIVRGRMLGALSFVTSESGRRYSPADLVLGEEIARRAALAMDNARLYREAQASEARFRRVFESNIIGIIFWDVSGNITEANDAFLKMVGYTREELLSQKVHWKAMTPAQYESVDASALAEIAATGACSPFEKEYIRKDGSWVPVLIGGAFLEGFQDRGVSFVLDLTERQRAEAALRQSEERYRRFIEQSSEGIWRFELEVPISTACPEDEQIQHFYQSGYLAECNNAMAQMYGFAEATELAGTRLDELLVRSDPQNTQYLRAFIRSGYRLSDAESHEVDKQGHSRYFLNNLVGTVEQGVLVRAWGSQRDITEWKQAQTTLHSRARELARLTTILSQTNAALEKRNQELDQFAYVASHDLKAPLRAIANLSEWIEEDLKDKLTEDTQHQMNLLRGRVHRMNALIDGILKYSRVGRVETELETVVLDKLLAEVIDTLAPPPEFMIEVMPGMPTLLTVRVLLEQVFSNLISNAIKHHHRADGHVQLAAQDQGEFYEFTVADDGPGIPPEYHEKVFGIFQTLEARDKSDNTGIGLSVVKKIVESQGGTIRLESQALEGAMFRFTWPKQPRKQT
ncbi:MAG TPA: PAS domain S-box protein, partial [Candidatus Caenarcaniphilales bacterium]